MVNVLITGGAGNVGSSLAKKLLTNYNYRVVIVDNLITGLETNIPIHHNLIFIKADVNIFNEISVIMTKYNFDFVFHYAALVGVIRTISNPLLVLNDVEGIKNILNLSKNTNVKRVFFSSSSEVYGEPVCIPQNELTTPLNSKLPYSLVKNISEVYLKTYLKEYNLSFTIFRFFNTYGPNQSYDFVIQSFISKAINNEDLTIYGNGLQTRTFCYIDDNINSTVYFFENNLFINDIVNIGNDVEYNIIDVAKLIIKLTNSKSKIKFINPLLEGDMLRRKPDLENMKKFYKKDLISLEQGIIKIINKK